MNDKLDVLLIESHPGAGAAAAHALEQAGHTVHRCFETTTRGFPCRALTDTCPLDGNVDVAFLARDHVTPRATPLEAGVTCAVRAQVPVVECGPDILDPFAPWIAQRIDRGDDPVPACEAVADAAFDSLATAILDRVAAVANAAGLGRDDISCHIRRAGADLVVQLLLAEPPSAATTQALGVRVLDAVHADGRTFGTVDVHVGVQDARVSSPSTSDNAGS
jgi:hypothetical protein